MEARLSFPRATLASVSLLQPACGAKAARNARRQHEALKAARALQKPPEFGLAAQPTLDAIRKLAVALQVSADMLLFEKDERGPDEDLFQRMGEERAQRRRG